MLVGTLLGVFFWVILFIALHGVVVGVSYVIAAGIDASFARSSKERRRAVFMVLVLVVCAVFKTLTVLATGAIPLWGAQFLFELGLFVAQSFLAYGIGVLFWKGWMRIRRSHAAGKYRAPTLSLFLAMFLLAISAVSVSAHVGVVVETIDAEDAAGNTIAGCPKAVRISRLGHTHLGTDGSGYVFITTRKGDTVVDGKLVSGSVPAARLRYRVHHDSITYSAGLQASRSLSFRLRCGLRYCGPSTVEKATDASRADVGTVLTLPWEWFAATLRHDRSQGAAWPFPTLRVSAGTEIAHHDLARIAVAVGNTNSGESWTQNRTTIERAIPKEYVQFERDGGKYYRFDPVLDYGDHDRKHVASQSASIRIPLVGGRMDELPACIKAITLDTSPFPGFYVNIDITEFGVWGLRWVSDADRYFQRRGINAAPTPLPLADFDFERYFDGALSTVPRPIVTFRISEKGSGIAVAGAAARRLITAVPSPMPAPVVAPTPMPTPWPTPSPTPACQFSGGFAMLRDLIGHDIVGDCLENEHYNAIGNSTQRTTGGLLVWHKADNWTAFTDGYRTWINGPHGLQQRLNTERFDWEASLPRLRSA